MHYKNVFLVMFSQSIKRKRSQVFLYFFYIYFKLTLHRHNSTMRLYSLETIALNTITFNYALHETQVTFPK